MRKMRLLFKKTGRAAFISHLDTMRTLQRAIARADVAAKHTEGFNPHAYISIALPLSLGYTSDCEMMNFVAEDAMTGDTITARLNAVLPEGLIAVRTYETERKVKEICAARFVITLDYDDGVPEGCGGALKQFYTNSPVYVMKKSKRGEKQVDITPLIREIEIEEHEKCVKIMATLAAGNESLNPEYMVRALREQLPRLAPNDASFHRTAVLDNNLCDFA